MPSRRGVVSGLRSLVGTWTRVLLLIGTCVYTLVGGAIQTGRIPQDFKSQFGWALDWSLYLATTAVLIGGYFGAFFLERAVEPERKKRQDAERLLAREDRLRHCEESCLAVLAGVSLVHGVPMLSLSAHLWQVRDGRMEEITSVKMKKLANPPLSFALGKGLVGRCWETGKSDVLDLGPIVGRAAFNKLHVAKKFGLTYDDWKASYTRSRWVYPFHSRPAHRDPAGPVVGCLSVDSTDEASGPGMTAAHDDESLNEVVRLIELLFSDALPSDD